MHSRASTVLEEPIAGNLSDAQLILPPATGAVIAVQVVCPKAGGEREHRLSITATLPSCSR
jgi:hypothetical protein